MVNTVNEKQFCRHTVTTFGDVSETITFLPNDIMVNLLYSINMYLHVIQATSDEQ